MYRCSDKRVVAPLILHILFVVVGSLLASQEFDLKPVVGYASVLCTNASLIAVITFNAY